MGHRTHVTVSLQRRVRMESDFRRAILRHALEVIQRRTKSLWVNTEHKASKDVVKGHHKRGLCGCFILVALFFFLVWMHGYSLDMWMYNFIIMITLTLIRQCDYTTLIN